jgi:adenylate kinase family enzyme
VRFIVVGTTGCGKSTLAREISLLASAPYVELDALYWSADWSERLKAEFVKDVSLVASGERWVFDGNYIDALPVVLPRATHVVWLNFDRATVFYRLFARTLRRSVFRERLWHGNIESITRSFFSRKSVLLVFLRNYSKYKNRYIEFRNDANYQHLNWVELKNPNDARKFISYFKSSVDF